MSVFGIVFLFLFSGNVTLRAGVGLEPARADRHALRTGLALAPAAALAAFLYRLILDFVTGPFALDILSPVLFLFVSGTAVALVSLAMPAGRGGQDAGHRSRGYPEALSRSLADGFLFAVALLVSRADTGIADSLLAGFAAGLGRWAATGLLESLSRKNETEDVPKALRGVPIYFISASLVALAFGGLDQILARVFGV